MRDEAARAAAIGLLIGWPPLALSVLTFLIYRAWRRRFGKSEFIQGVDKLERTPWS